MVLRIFKLISMILVTFSISCADSPEIGEPVVRSTPAQSKAQNTKGRAISNQSKQPYAEVITESTLKDQPHLEQFQGNFLIGNRYIQMIVAGVEPDKAEKFHGVLGLAFFTFQKGQWQKYESINRLKFQKNWFGRHLNIQVDAITPNLDQENETAELTLVFTSGAKTRKKEFIHLYLLKDQPSIYVSIHQPAKDRKSSGKGGGLSFQLERFVGQTLALDRKENLTTSFQHYFNSQQLRVSGSQRFYFKSSAKQIEFRSPGINAGGWNGFRFNIGSNFADDSILFSSGTKSCHTSKKFTKTALSSETFPQYLKMLQECLSSHPSSQLIISSEEEPSSLNNTRHFKLLNYQGRPLLLASIQAGQSRSIQLRPKKRYKIQEVLTGEIWGSSTPVSLSTGSSEKLSLSARQFTSLSIAPKNISGAVMLSIKSQTDPSGIDLTKVVEIKSNGIMMSNTIFLAKQWPIEIKTLAGKYQIDLFKEGASGLICSLKVDLRPEENKSFNCENTSKSEPNSETSVDLDTPTNMETKNGLREALNISHFPSQHSQDNALNNQLEKIELFDSRHSLKLLIMTQNVAAKKNWQAMHEKTPHIDFMQAVTFFKAADKNAIIELSCPNNNISPAAYEKMVNALRPHALQLFDCPQMDNSLKLADHFASLYQKGSLPAPFITPASGFRRPNGSAYFAKIIINNPQSGSNDIFRNLRQGDFSVASGASIKVKSIKAKPSSALNVLTMQLDLTSKPNTQIQSLRVLSPKGELLHKRLNIDLSSSRQETITFKIPNKSSIFRVEISGHINNNGKKAVKNIILATTNYLKVSNSQR